MAIAVITRPSDWSAVKNPTVYKLRREDNTFDQVNDVGGFAQFQFNFVDLSTYYEVGNDVYAEYSTGLFGAVTAVNFSGGNTHVTTDIPVGSTGGITGVLNNLSKRTDYRIEAEVFKSSDDESLTGGVLFSFTPDNTGLAYVDISAIIKAFLAPEWIEPSALNEVEADTSLKTYIKYQEYYDGALVGSQTSDSANPIHCVFAGLQIPSANGNNLTDYVPEDDTKKFLTLFDRPKLWRGYPATLSFIFPDALALTVARSQYDAGGTIIGSEDVDTLDDANDDSVNRLDLTSGITLDDGAATLKTKLEISPDDYTEELTIDVQDPCSNPVLLFWKNSLGGDAWWLFEHGQDYTFARNNSKKAKRLTLYAENLTLNQWEALNELNTLGEVYLQNIQEFTSSVNKSHLRDGAQVYVVDTNGDKIGVIVIPTTSTIFTKDETHQIQVEIEYPQRYE